MIRTIKGKDLRRYAEKGDASKLSALDHRARIDRILVRLNAAATPKEMDIPGLGFHPLKGSKKGRYSVWVSGNWRITFGWDGEDAIDVDLEDYR